MPTERHRRKPAPQKRPRGRPKGSKRRDLEVETGGLTLKMEMALNEFLRNGGNKAAAMRAAGYSDKYAGHMSKKVFTNPIVVERIKRHYDDIRQKTTVTQDWVVERLKRIADFSLGDVIMKLQQNGYNFAVLTPEERYSLGEIVQEEFSIGRGENAVPAVKTKIKSKDQLQALQLIMRHLGMFNDRMTVSHELTLVERLQRGRDRVKKGADALPPPEPVDAEFKEVD